MPASPALAENLAAATVEHYAEAERLLIVRMARYLGEGLDAPTWVEQKLLAVQLLQRQAQQVLARLERDGGASISEAVATAYNRGGAAAVADLAGLGVGRLEELAEPLRVPGAQAVDRLVEDAVTTVQSTHLRILRRVVDGYREVVARTSAQVLLGTVTRRQAAQRALDEFAGRGVTGFVDARGRGWDLASYVEMAVRSATGRAAVDAHTDRLQALGQDLVIVSDAPQECVLCRPWEGKVLSLSGAPRVDGVRVAGTLEQARAAGLMHPNCRHSTSVYLPGVTRTPRRTADPAGDAARQKLRYLERRVRSWKRLEAAALDDDGAARARAHIREFQAKIREHVETTSAKRQPVRERAGAAR